jgi:hypothetical protein
MNKKTTQQIFILVFKYLIAFPEVIFAAVIVIFPHSIVTMLNEVTGDICQHSEPCRVLAPAVVILTISISSFFVRRLFSGLAAAKIGGFHFLVIGVAAIVLVKYLSKPMVLEPYWIASISPFDRLIEVFSCVGLGYVIGDVMYFVYLKTNGRL